MNSRVCERRHFNSSNWKLHCCCTVTCAYDVWRTTGNADRSTSCTLLHWLWYMNRNPLCKFNILVDVKCINVSKFIWFTSYCYIHGCLLPLAWIYLPVSALSELNRMRLYRTICHESPPSENTQQDGYHIPLFSNIPIQNLPISFSMDFSVHVLLLLR